MNNYDALKLRVYESCDFDDAKTFIDVMESASDEEFSDICLAVESMMDEMYVTESVLGPVHSFKKELEKIKDLRITKDSDSDEISEFIDKHYDKLKQCSEILEKEPDKLKKSQIAFFIVECAALVTFAATVEISAVVGIVSWSIAGITLMIQCILGDIRANDDIGAMKNLIKIRDSLAKLKGRKDLKDSDKKKIERLIQSIDDADIEINGTVTVRKS